MTGPGVRKQCLYRMLNSQRDMGMGHRDEQREKEETEQKGKVMDPWETEEMATFPDLTVSALSLESSHAALAWYSWFSTSSSLCVSSSESSKLKVQHLCLPGSALMPRTQLQARHQMASRINKEWALGQERGRRSTRSPQHGGQQHRSEWPLQL